MDEISMGYLDIIARTEFDSLMNDKGTGRIEVFYYETDRFNFALKVLGSFWP